MRKAVFFALILLCSCLVFAAGEMRTIDFSNSSALLVQINTHDGVRFDWGDKNHKVVIRNINVAKNLVEVTNFVEGAPTPYYTSLNPKTTIMLDFDRDDVRDLEISLVKFVDNDTVILLFQKLSEPKPPTEGGNVQVTGWFTKVFSKGPFNSAYYNLGLLIVIVIVVILLLSTRPVRRGYRRWRRSMRLG
ncbi:MAG: hypothetical protein QW404_01970 [Candidatus Nanoarchaeia archaeon]